MTRVLRADDVPAPARREYWHDVVGELLGPIEVRPGALGAQDQVRLDTAGALRLAELTTGTSGGATLLGSHIRRADADMCKIDVLAHGRGVVEQDGRTARLGPGDFAVVDLSRPVRWTMSEMRLVAVVFPRALLPVPAVPTGVTFPGDRGVSALVSTMAREIARRQGEWSAVDGVRLGTALLDLLTVALAARQDRLADVAPTTSRHALLLQIQAYVEQHLADPELAPGGIAAAHHISLRYLYKLFEEQGLTVADWIRQRRLERCRRDLLDPALRDRPVSAIGARWGLTNPAHFSRVFRAAYGRPPTEYRASYPG